MIILDYLDGPSVITWTLKSIRGISQRDAIEESGEIQSMRRTYSVTAGFENAGKGHELRNMVGSRSWKWPLAHSQEGNGDLSYTITENWILPIIRMSKEINSPLEPPEEHSLASTLTLAQWDSCWNSNLKKCKIIHLCCVNYYFNGNLFRTAIEN